MKIVLPLCILLTLTGASAQARPTVLELFTSQSCSSCPPADALLGKLKASGADLLPLSLHVTYWNGAGWTDPYSLPQTTSRQRAYAAALSSDVFTPELVIDGRAFAVGSDRTAVLAAIAKAQRSQAEGPVLALRATTGGLSATIGAGSGEADLLLVGYDPEHTTRIAGGENGGVQARTGRAGPGKSNSPHPRGRTPPLSCSVQMGRSWPQRHAERKRHDSW